MSTVLNQYVSDRVALYHCDTVEVAKSLPPKSVHFSVFSPPFASLFSYSNSDRDLSNNVDYETFFAHYKHLIAETARVMMPGRLVAIHCMQIPTLKHRDGFIGLRDFRGEIIRAYQDAGFIYHSEICIWKDPVTAMQRTKALGLLHKTIRKDSSMSRQGIADYVVVMRAPGANPEPIAHPDETFPVLMWQRYASPVWVTRGGTDADGFALCSSLQSPTDDTSGINQSDTLQARSAREDEDERHLCPLQLEVTRRCVKLWSNPGDTVWSPFAGIGSELVVALQEGRRGLGAELKRSYYAQAVKNVMSVEAGAGRQGELFATA